MIWDAEHGIRPYVPPVPYRRPWKVYAVTISLSVLIGIIGGYALHSMQMGVALNNLHATTERLIMRTEHMEHPERTLTKAAAQVISAKREKERVEP